MADTTHMAMVAPHHQVDHFNPTNKTMNPTHLLSYTSKCLRRQAID